METGAEKEKIQKTKVKQNDLNLVIWPVSKTLLKQQYVLSKQTVYLCDRACQSAFLQMLICVQRAEGDEKLTCEEWIQLFFLKFVFNILVLWWGFCCVSLSLCAWS